jgi:uncharacterized protein YrrD/ElaB/YqjD/DUF883 family membrane-anchored ribosome-binding protein
MPKRKPKPLRNSLLLHRLVLHHDTTDELGRVEVVWMYPDAHRVLGFVSKKGLIGSKRLAFTLNQVYRLGDDSIVVQGQPTETEVAKVRQLESVLGLEIWSETGNKLGKVVDFAFHPRTGTIPYYLFTSDGWLGLASGVYRLPPRYITSMGRDRILVTDTDSQTFKIDKEGLQDRVAHMGDRLRHGYGDMAEGVAEELQDFAQQAQSTTQKLTGRFGQRFSQWGQQAKQWSQELREQGQPWMEETREQAQHWRDRLSEQKPGEFTETVKTKGRSLFEQIKQQASLLSDRIEDFDFIHLDDLLDEERRQARGEAPKVVDPDVDMEEEDFDALFEEDWAEMTEPEGSAEPAPSPVSESTSTSQPASETPSEPPSAAIAPPDIPDDASPSEPENRPTAVAPVTESIEVTDPTDPTDPSAASSELSSDDRMDEQNLDDSDALDSDENSSSSAIAPTSNQAGQLQADTPIKPDLIPGDDLDDDDPWV